MEDRVLLNNIQGKKQEVDDHHRNVKFSKNKTFVTACNDSLNAKILNVNSVCATCGKCVLNAKHDMCVLKSRNDVNSRTKMPIVVRVSTREPKRIVKQSIAKPLIKTVASESTNHKPKNTFRKLYEHVSKACSWWYPKFNPPGYNWKSKSKIGNVEPNVSMLLGNASRTANILKHMTSRRSTVSNTPLSSNSFAARRDYPIHHRLWTMASVQFSSDPAPECQTMALEHVSLSPGCKCQENASHGDKTDTTSNELDLLFSLMFDELLNGSTKVVSKSLAVSAADAPNQPMKHLDADLSGTPIDQTKYQSMVGELIYLTASRPDIVHATCYCARYQAKPTEKHLTAVKQIFRYLKDTIHMGLWYSKDIGFELTAFLDLDHAGYLDLRKSTSGGIQFLGGDKLVSWSSKKQDHTSMSLAEADLPMYCDSKAAIAILCNPVQHSHTKHIDVRYHFINEKVQKGIVELFFVGTKYQLADLFTKALPEERFKYLVRRLGMRCLTPEELEVLANESA
nr:hypothetical protein [Tanacetum cinerariifolium]